MSREAGDIGPKLAIIVLTHNEERNLPECLRSLEGLTYDLFVMDSGSTDRTIEIATQAGGTVNHHDFDDYSAQRNRAQASLPRKFEWVLHLDADERLTPELVAEIDTVLAGTERVDGYLFRKRTIFLGRWIKHGGHYPSYHLRLFRPDKGRCEERRYDQHFIVDGKVLTLRNDYLDIVASDLRSWSQRHIRWAEFEAAEIASPSVHGRRVRPKLGGTPIERKRWLRERVLYRMPLFVGPFLYFVYRYVVRGGFLDGREGLIFHFLQGCWYRFLVDGFTFEERRAS